MSNLDAKLRAQTRLEIQKLHRELGVTSLFVTHDQVEAMNATLPSPKIGDIVRLDSTPERLHWFDAATGRRMS